MPPETGKKSISQKPKKSKRFAYAARVQHRTCATKDFYCLSLFVGGGNTPAKTLRFPTLPLLSRKLLVSLFLSNEGVMSLVSGRCVNVEKMCH